MDNPILIAFGSFSGLAVLIVALSAWINAQFKLRGTWARVTSLGWSAALSFGGYALDLGYLADANLLDTVVTALGLMLYSNGFFTLEYVKKALGVFAATRQPSIEDHITAP